MTSYQHSNIDISKTKKLISNASHHPKLVTLGNYNIHKKSIGKGAYSKIYFGTCRDTCDNVAVKIIKKKNIHNEKQILREISLLKMIKHPNIVYLKDVLMSNNKYYLILEYCKNGSLKKFMKGKILTENELYHYMTQIKDGLKELHKNHIIHRDLKPQNILVDEDENLKISDFGFAKIYNPENDLQKTMCGTPLYMAPEILMNKHPYSTIADLWSIGVIMYELFYNKVPIKGTNILDLIAKVKKFKYDIKTHLCVKSCTPQCQDLLNSLLQSDPKKRITWKDFFNHKWFQAELHKRDLIRTQTKINIDVTGTTDDDDDELCNQEEYDNYDCDITKEKCTHQESKECLKCKKISEDSSALFSMESYNSEEDSYEFESNNVKLQYNKSKNINIPSNKVKLTYSQKNAILYHTDDINTTSINNNYLDDLDIENESKIKIPKKRINSYDLEETEYCNENYVIISSPSETEQYYKPHARSFNIMENENQSATKYVHIKRIFTSLRDSISHIFGPRSL